MLQSVPEGFFVHALLESDHDFKCAYPDNFIVNSETTKGASLALWTVPVLKAYAILAMLHAGLKREDIKKDFILSADEHNVDHPIQAYLTK